MKRIHVHFGIALVTAIAVAAFVAGAISDPAVKTVFGTHLGEKGQSIYHVAASKGVEKGARSGEALPASVVAKLEVANQRAALEGTVGPNHPVTLATPEPKTIKSYVVNYSSRHGARPALLVVHDTESPNAAELQDVLAIRAWFNNPRAQASSNYTTDADGNTVEMVPDTSKAWTQAYFNPWAISDEMIGYASQKTWPETQLRAVARIFASESAKWGIPVQRAAVRGCTIVRPGILEHLDLGSCGGGHHDAGSAFPIVRFIALVKQYRDGGYHPAKQPVVTPKPKPAPAPKPKPKPLPVCSTRAIQRALDAHGYRLAVDGISGPRTKAALAAWKRAHPKATLVKGCRS